MKRSGAVAGAAALGLVVLAGGVGLASADVLDGISPLRAARMLHDSSAVHSMTVRSEAGYLAQMVPHHEEAVRAARHLSRSARPEMRRLGEDVVRVQTAEIASMERWLARWYPAQPASPSAPMMRDLSRLAGDALDRAFLEDMVPHHMMAVMMSRQLVARGLVEHAEVAAFAGSVVTSQHAEIVQMRQWLAAWFGIRTGPGMPHGMGLHHGAGTGPGMRMEPGTGMRMEPGTGMRMGPGTVPSLWSDDGAPAVAPASREVRVSVRPADQASAPRAAAAGVRPQAAVQQVHRTHRPPVSTGPQHRHGQHVLARPGRHR